jgi:predicted HTH domain antitoxin
MEMIYLTIPLPDHLLVSMNMNTEEIITSMRKEYGLKLYHQGKLTLSQSAEFSGMNIYEFMSLLTSSGIPVIDYNAEELENELKPYARNSKR